MIFSQRTVFVEKTRMSEWWASKAALRNGYFTDMLVTDGTRAVRIDGATLGRRIAFLSRLYHVTPHVVAVEPAPPLDEIQTRVLQGLKHEVWDDHDDIDELVAAVKHARSFEELVATLDV